MRLVGLIIAVLLAVTAGILVISTPHAAASGDQLAVAATVPGHDAAHSHGDTVDVEPASAHDHASARNDCGDPASGDHGNGGTDCCNMGACHAVQALATPMLHVPYASAAAIAALGDEQVEGIVPGGLDRPPRTV